MISVVAYLENEKVADLKSEYVDGRCLPVVGASRVHDLLSMRLTRLLSPLLRDSGCRLYRPSVKLRVPAPGGDRYYYPDLQVACDRPTDGASEQPEFLDCPRLILEVLSPASETRDRAEKATAYQWIRSLEEIVLVAHDACRIEVRRRTGGWVPESYGTGQTFRLESIGAELSVGEVYSGLAIEESPRPSGPPSLSLVPSSQIE
jgi:Uma2 family endonuclease